MTIPTPSQEVVQAFWHRVLAAGVVPVDTAVPTVVEAFGDSPELADELIGLVVDGPKRATAGALADYEHAQEPLPFVGRLAIATDGSGRPRAVLRTTEVRVGPLSSVDERFAWDEGEGDRTLSWWREAHEEFFARFLPTIGVVFDPDMATVFERFEVLYTE
jgi:uncharacterized protein YhfF